VTVLDRFSRILPVLSRRSDLIVAAIVLIAIVMMIVPLPTTLVDVIITINIAVSVLILLVAFYISTPLQFSSLPSVILIATLFRLAITISTSRLVLLQADAGEVVSAFGDFVIGGNVAVGLVIFFIITIAQFVVITKGGERVAEVAARFSLDAMPGKQMSIDSDLRNGDIDQAEARRLRRRLERESHLYGSMDGAMKFVKGDAIASLIVILVNLIGGIIVGTMQQGMSFAQAMHTYSLLTVGDGLVAQIPALLVSVAAGTVVTRVSSDERRDLGSDISRQLINDERALFLASAILIGLAFMPGFPTYIFLALGGALLAGGWLVYRRNEARGTRDLEEEITPVRATQAETALSTVTEPPATGQRVTVRIGASLGQVVAPDAFAAGVNTLREDLHNDLGVSIPRVDLRTDPALEPGRFRIELEDVPVAEGMIPADKLLIDDEPVHLDLLGVRYEKGAPIFGRREAIWVDRQHEGALNAAGVGFLSAHDVLSRALAQMLRRYATHFIGIQETRQLLAKAETEYGELVGEAQKVASLQKIAEILRRLIEENVPIRNLRLIFEALVEWGPREQDVVLLVEYVRMALGRQICFRCADRNRVIAAYVLERSVEDMVRGAVRPTAVGTFLSISDEAARPIIEQIRGLQGGVKADVQPVVLATMDVRRHLRNLLARNEIDIPVLSYQELAPEFSVQPLATVAREIPGGTQRPPERGERRTAQQAVR
jgi:type III secretion protein V